MSDRRAVSAGHLGASSVAAAHETWRVAVGGNRVENMTVDQIARAFQSGHLNARTPLWPPGTTGWQALGNFEQFQSYPQGGAGYGNAGYDNAGYDNSGGLSQFEEADDDPTRMWTGTGDIELPGMQDMQAPPPPMEQRPSARTGPRQVSRPMQSQAGPSRMTSQPVPSQPMPSQSAPLRAAPMPSQPSVAARPAPMPMPMPPPAPSLASRTPALVPSSASPYRQSRGNGLMLVAGLVGLVGLGSAILAARGNWGSASEPAPASAEAAAPEAAAPPAEVSRPVAEAPRVEPAKPEPRAAEPAKVEGGEAQLAKYEDGASPASAFVAGEPAKATEKAEKANEAEVAADEPRADSKKRDRQEAEPREPAAKAEKAVKSARVRNEEPAPKRVSSRAAPRRAVAAAALPRQKPAPTPPPPPRVEKVEKAEKAEAAETQQAPANAAVNQNAAAALATSANLASSCRPRGGPAGAGKARVIYSNDGEVQSVEILTAKFRDTLTGSCVRMVFRRAKIPAFKGEPPTFIKSFTIPEE
jgi:hypothetical protein